MTTSYQNRTAHLIGHWGVPKEIYEQKLLMDSKLAVIEFAPQRKAGFWRFATNGMSEHLQFVNGDGVRTELVAYATHQHKWIIELLDALSRYPFQQQTYFSEFDTVEVGQPIDRDSSAFQGILLAPVPAIETSSLRRIGGLFSEVVTLLQVIGLHQIEIEIAIDQGGQVLFDSFKGNGPILIDAKRPAVQM